MEKENPLHPEFEAWLWVEGPRVDPEIIIATADGESVFFGPVLACQKSEWGPCNGPLLQLWSRGTGKSSSFLCHEHAMSTVANLNRLNAHKT